MMERAEILAAMAGIKLVGMRAPAQSHWGGPWSRSVLRDDSE